MDASKISKLSTQNDADSTLFPADASRPLRSSTARERGYEAVRYAAAIPTGVGIELGAARVP